MYLITSKNCLEQYVGSATNFKSHFRIHKSDIKTNKDIRGTATLFNGMCKNNSNSFCLLKLLSKFLVMPQTLNKFYGTGKTLAKPVIHNDSGMNSLTDLYCSKRKEYRK